MNDYYNHVSLWLKANKPKYVIILVTYNDKETEWLLEDVIVYSDGDVMIDGIHFDKYVGAVFNHATCRFFKFTEPGKKEEI